MKKKLAVLNRPLIWSFLGLLFLFALWYLISYLMRIGGNYLLPYPHEVLVALGEILFLEEAQTTYIAIGWSLARILIGFSSAFILAAIFGTLAGLYPALKHFMKPGISLMRAFPTAAIVVVLIGIFYSYRGLPDYIPSILGFLVVFPIIYEAFRGGIEDLSLDIKDATELDVGLKSIKGIFNVGWPLSWNYIRLAISQSLGLAFKVTIMSEILVRGGMSGGLGVQIAFYQEWLQMDKVIAVSLIAIILIVIIDSITHYLKKTPVGAKKAN